MKNESDYLDIIKNEISTIKEKAVEDLGVTEDMRIDYYGLSLDSLQLMTLLVRLEAELEFEMDESDLSLVKFVFVRDIIQMLKEKRNAEGSRDE